MKRNLLLVLLLSFIMSCGNGKYEKTDDGFTVFLNGKNKNKAKTIRVKVITDKIIQVTANGENIIDSANSLMIAGTPGKETDWQLKEEKEFLILKTSELHLIISLKTGEIEFTDTANNRILAEQKGGGKSLIPFKIGNKKYKHIRQVFESPSDEAFYGLGQHQEGILNYKGEDVELYQYNTKVSVPFIISNKNYGVLWDNYSLSKFGDVRNYEQISSLKLYSEEGTPGGLTALYSNDGKEYTQRTEVEINYEFLSDLPKIPSGFQAGNGKVTWSGYVESDTSGLHKFRIYSAGYLSLTIDNKVIIPKKWRQSWNASTTSFKFDMQKGVKYKINIEWIPDGNESFISMKWLSPLPDQEQNRFSIYSETAKQIDYYFIKGNNTDEVIGGYRYLTGKALLIPKWVFGFWQSRERYKTQDDILAVVAEYRKRQIPIDNIVLDWQYWPDDKWGDHDFDPVRFPDPVGMINALHNKYKINLMISVWPKFYMGTKNFNLMNSKGWLYKQNISDNRKDWLGYRSTFYDAFNADARDFFWDQINEKLYSKGVDAWWLDATEPDMHSNLSVEVRKGLMNPTAMGPGSEYFNSFSLVNCQGVYEGQRRVNPDTRIFILTRSAYAGQQRYSAATWSGDIGACWNEMKLQIPAGLNFSVSGIPYWTMDIGGFSVEQRFQNPNEENLEEWRELLTRWYQFGAFCPIFRAHGQFPYREIYNIAPDSHPAYQAMVDIDKLRYRLLPYIYTLAGMSYHHDYTMMRPLFMDFPEDIAVSNNDDQYLFGPSLLICPVYEYKARSRKVYLPANNNWFDFFNGTYYKGGQYINATAPYSRIPVYVKEGSIIPMGPELQYTSEKPVDPVTLMVYTGRDATFTLYEDDGISNNYEKGAYSEIPITYSEENKILTIGQRSGSYPEMILSRLFKIFVFSETKPGPLNPDMIPEFTVLYNGNPVEITIH